MTTIDLAPNPGLDAYTSGVEESKCSTDQTNNTIIESLLKKKPTIQKFLDIQATAFHEPLKIYSSEYNFVNCVSKHILKSIENGNSTFSERSQKFFDDSSNKYAIDLATYIKKNYGSSGDNFYQTVFKAFTFEKGYVRINEDENGEDMEFHCIELMDVFNVHDGQICYEMYVELILPGIYSGVQEFITGESILVFAMHSIKFSK